MIQRPSQYLLRIAVFLAVIVGLAGLLFQALIGAFMANPALNGLILGVLLVAIGFAIREVLRLTPEVNWLERVQRGDPRSFGPGPVLLAPMARLVDGGKVESLRLSPPAMRSLLDGVAARLHESRELNRYAIGLLVFLGLLGTFWGLLQTISAISNVVGGLNVGTGDIGAVFDELKAGLEAPLAGMSTAFSSSLFGLAGSLILGFVDLQAGQAQNRFYTELEDWLSENIDVPSDVEAPGRYEGGQVPVAYLAALVEQNNEGIDRLTDVVSTAEADRRATTQALSILTENLNIIAEQTITQQQLLQQLGALTGELAPVIATMSEGMRQGEFGLDRDSQQNLRDIKLYMARLLDDSALGRAEMMDALRDDLRLLARTIAYSAERQGLEIPETEPTPRPDPVATATPMPNPAPAPASPPTPAPEPPATATAEQAPPKPAVRKLDLPFKPAGRESAPQNNKPAADSPDDDEFASRSRMPDWLAPRRPDEDS